MSLRVRVSRVLLVKSEFECGTAAGPETAMVVIEEDAAVAYDRSGPPLPACGRDEVELVEVRPLPPRAPDVTGGELYGTKGA